MENTNTFLKDIRKVKWKSLSHAYGTSENIRTALIKLWNITQKLKVVSTEEEVKKCNYTFSKNLDILSNYLYHQGTIYEPTAESIPFLIELIPHLPFTQQHQIIFLLYNFSKGQTYYIQHESYFNNWQSYTQEEYTILIAEENKILEKMYDLFPIQINRLSFFWEKLEEKDDENCNYGNLIGIILLLISNLVERNPTLISEFKIWFKKANQPIVWNLKNTSSEITTLRCYVLEMWKKTSPSFPTHLALLQKKSLQLAKNNTSLEQEKLIAICALLNLGKYEKAFDELLLPLVENMQTIEENFEKDFLYLSIYIPFSRYVALSLARLATL